MNTFFYSNISDFAWKFARNDLLSNIQDNHTEYAQAWLEGKIIQVLWCIDVRFMVVVFHDILSFMTELKIYEMLPCPYVGSYSGENGHTFWQ